MNPDDMEKTTFTTPWGMFMYKKFPFGLIKAGATFQHAMDIAFVSEKDKLIFIYLDDMNMYSTSDAYHLKQLRNTFLKCHKYGLSLNPKKTHFSMEEGKLLGHIISNDGVKIDPE